MLLAFAGPDRDCFILEARLFEEGYDLHGVRGRVEIALDHERLLQVWGIGNSRRGGVGLAASRTPMTMTTNARQSIGIGTSPRTGMARIDATAGRSAIVAVAEERGRPVKGDDGDAAHQHILAIGLDRYPASRGATEMAEAQKKIGRKKQKRGLCRSAQQTGSVSVRCGEQLRVSGRHGSGEHESVERRRPRRGVEAFRISRRQILIGGVGEHGVPCAIVLREAGRCSAHADRLAGTIWRCAQSGAPARSSTAAPDESSIIVVGLALHPR